MRRWRYLNHRARLSTEIKLAPLQHRQRAFPPNIHGKEPDHLWLVGVTNINHFHHGVRKRKEVPIKSHQAMGLKIQRCFAGKLGSCKTRECTRCIQNPSAIFCTGCRSKRTIVTPCDMTISIHKEELGLGENDGTLRIF